MHTEKIRNAYTLVNGWFKKMGSREMGRHWSTEERTANINHAGEAKGAKRKYPKCVPLAKATRMTKGQKAICCQTEKEQPVIQVVNLD